MISIYDSKESLRKISFRLTSSFSKVNLNECIFYPLNVFQRVLKYRKTFHGRKNRRIITTYIYFDSFIHKMCELQLIYELTCVFP